MSGIVRLPTMLSARTVARRLRKSRAWVYARCVDGSFAGAYRDPGWRIPEPSVLAYIDARRAGLPDDACRCSTCPRRTATGEAFCARSCVT